MSTTHKKHLIKRKNVINRGAGIKWGSELNRNDIYYLEAQALDLVTFKFWICNPSRYFQIAPHRRPAQPEWTSLRRLNLSNNNLKKVPFLLETRLEYLDVSNNRIDEFPHNIPTSLKSLNMKNNCLGSHITITISSSAIMNEKRGPDKMSLKYLNVTSNKIETMFTNTLVFPNLEYFYFHKNPLKCFPWNISHFMKLKNLTIPFGDHRLILRGFHRAVKENNLDINKMESLEYIHVALDICSDCELRGPKLIRCISKPSKQLFPKLKSFYWYDSFPQNTKETLGF